MTIEAAIDNDVLIKCACYDLLDETTAGLGGPGSTAILGAARYVVGDQLARREDVQDSSGAEERFARFLETTVELEPTDEEVDLATAIEEFAVRENLPIDEGESQLCAIVVCRSISAVMTGDKRAIESLEVVVNGLQELTQLQERVICLEQLVKALVERIGASGTRSRVCAESRIDRAISICFECTQAAEPPGFAPVGLQSYVDELRTRAPTVMKPDGALF